MFSNFIFNVYLFWPYTDFFFFNLRNKISRHCILYHYDKLFLVSYHLMIDELKEVSEMWKKGNHFCLHKLQPFVALLYFLTSWIWCNERRPHLHLLPLKFHPHTLQIELALLKERKTSISEQFVASPAWVSEKDKKK